MNFLLAEKKLLLEILGFKVALFASCHFTSCLWAWPLVTSREAEALSGCISDSDEEVVEDSIILGISPYSFEPVVSDGSDGDNSGSNSDPSDDGEDRTTNQTWYGQSSLFW